MSYTGIESNEVPEPLAGCFPPEQRDILKMNSIYIKFNHLSCGVMSFAEVFSVYDEFLDDVDKLVVTFTLTDMIVIVAVDENMHVGT